MLFSDFVSAHNYINIEDNNLKINLNESIMHILGCLLFILTLLGLFIGTYIVLNYSIDINYIISFYILMFFGLYVFYFSMEDYNNAKKINDYINTNGFIKKSQIPLTKECKTIKKTNLKV